MIDPVHSRGVRQISGPSRWLRGACAVPKREVEDHERFGPVFEIAALRRPR